MLVSGGELKGQRRKVGPSSKGLDPTESLRFFGATPREPLKPKAKKVRMWIILHYLHVSQLKDLDFTCDT